MTPEHERMREQVLGYEDLELAERAAIDGHLAGCAACRGLRAALLEREAEARALGTLPKESLDLTVAMAAGPALILASARDPEILADERRSLEQLIDRIAAARPAPRAAARPAPQPVPRAPSRARPSLAWWLVPAAVAAAALLWVRPPGRGVPELPAPPGLAALVSAAITPVSGVRGARDRGYHTGDAFVLSLRLRGPGVPVVVVVDGAGEVALLHPTSDREARERGPGLVELPDSSMSERWIFRGSPGVETFLSAAAPARDFAWQRLRAEVEALGRTPMRSGSPDSARLARVESARLLLDRAWGPVQRVIVEHLP